MTPETSYPGVNGTDYIVTVSDQNGCEAIDTINVSWDLWILEIDTVSGLYVSCNGASTGYVAISMNENYGKIKRFQRILRSRPFDLKEYQPKIMMLKDHVG